MWLDDGPMRCVSLSKAIGYGQAADTAPDRSLLPSISATATVGCDRVYGREVNLSMTVAKTFRPASPG